MKSPRALACRRANASFAFCRASPTRPSRAEQIPGGNLRQVAVFQGVAKDVGEEELGPRGIRVIQQQGSGDHEPKLAQVDGAQRLVLQFAQPAAAATAYSPLKNDIQGQGQQRHALNEGLIFSTSVAAWPNKPA